MFVIVCYNHLCALECFASFFLIAMAVFYFISSGKNHHKLLNKISDLGENA